MHIIGWYRSIKQQLNKVSVQFATHGHLQQTNGQKISVSLAPGNIYLPHVLLAKRATSQGM